MVSILFQKFTYIADIKMKQTRIRIRIRLYPAVLFPLLLSISDEI